MWESRAREARRGKCQLNALGAGNNGKTRHGNETKECRERKNIIQLRQWSSECCNGNRQRFPPFSGINGTMGRLHDGLMGW